MSMTGNGMANAVVASLESSFPGMTDAEKAQLVQSMEAFCSAIVSYIQSNATVNPGSMSAFGYPVVGSGTVS